MLPDRSGAEAQQLDPEAPRTWVAKLVLTAHVVAGSINQTDVSGKSFVPRSRFKETHRSTSVAIHSAQARLTDQTRSPKTSGKSTKTTMLCRVYNFRYDRYPKEFDSNTSDHAQLNLAYWRTTRCVS